MQHAIQNRSAISAVFSIGAAEMSFRNAVFFAPTRVPKLCHEEVTDRMPPNPPHHSRVFVVDDDEHTRDSVGALLVGLGIEVRTFSKAAAFHRFYRPHMRGCLLLGIRRSCLSGLALYEQLLNEGKKLPVIFLAAHGDVSTAVTAMKLGALEFLEKPYQRETLVDLVRKAIELDAQWWARQEQFTSVAARVARLSPTQRDIVEMIRAGETNKTIAAKLAVTERAVEMRRCTIMRKLDVGNAAELISLVTTHHTLAELRGMPRCRLCC
jgi:FixJ family two-component response regulator